MLKKVVIGFAREAIVLGLCCGAGVVLAAAFPFVIYFVGDDDGPKR